MKAVIVIFLLLLLYWCFGCAITDEERNNRLTRIAQIEKEYYAFVNDCQMLEGNLVIESTRRVHNAPITVWEMKDAVCYYDDAYPTRMN